MGKSVFIAWTAGEEKDGILTGFKNLGYTVTYAGDGEEALKTLAGCKGLSAILLNSSLEKVSVVDVCRELIKTQRFSGIPLLILESKPVKKEVFESLGVSQFIERPFYPTQIDRIIESLQSSPKGGGKKISMKKWQTPGAVIFAILFVLFLLYFILGPMFLNK